VRAVRGGQVAAPQRGTGGHDTWLEHYLDDVLAVIDAAVRERWSRWFELLHSDLLIGDLHQVVLTLRRV